MAVFSLMDFNASSLGSTKSFWIYVKWLFIKCLFIKWLQAYIIQRTCCWHKRTVSMWYSYK